MKLTVVILTALALQVSASGNAQITLKEKSASLEQVIKKIRQQSGYDFFYNTAMLSVAKPVTISVTNVSVQEALAICFKDQPLTYAIEEKTIIIKHASPGNQSNVTTNPEPEPIRITGIVTDSTGKGLEGATVKVLNSRLVTKTNAAGEFTFTDVPPNSSIMVSHVGFAPQIISLSKAPSPLYIKMVAAENQMTGIIINTGIFKKADKSFTGASTTVSLKELQEFGNRSLITSLANIDPSLNIIENNQFGSDPNRLPDLRLRGSSTLPNLSQLTQNAGGIAIAGLNTPLIILDGFQSTLQKLVDMNENEVESITILKDAAATAIYGSRASNGVIVVTTKAPKIGKARITFRGDVNMEMPDLSSYSLLKAKDKLALEKLAGYYDDLTDNTRDIELKKYYNHVQNEINSGVETDWLAIPVQNGVGQRYNLNIDGGDQAFRYSASAQLNNTIGAMKGSYRKNFNGAVTLSYNTRKYKLRNNLQIQEGKSQNSPYGSFSTYALQNPYWRPYDNAGNALKRLGIPPADANAGYIAYWGSNQLPNPLYNATLYNFYDRGNVSQMINNTTLELTMIRDLIIRAQFGLTKNLTENNLFRPAGHTVFDNYTGADIARRGDYTYTTGKTLSYDGSVNFAYNKTLGLKHRIFAGLDFNARQDKGSNYGFVAEGFPNADFDFLPLALQYRAGSKPTGTEALTRSVGATGNVSYSYDDRYFIDGTYRIDGSSQFGKNKQYAPFWSAGFGWNVHNEKFFNSNNILTRLKIRGSVGLTGSQNFSAYQTVPTYLYSTSDIYSYLAAANLLGLGNPDLQWQQVNKKNIGADAEFLKGRYRLTVDYFTQTTTKMITTVDLPISNGYSSYIENYGSMRNSGFEVRATAFIIQNPKKFTWSVTASAVQNKNKILSTSQAYKDAQAGFVNNQNFSTVYAEGYSVNTIWAVKSLGIDPSNGKEVFEKLDGSSTYTWSGADVRAVGTTEPTIYGNISSLLIYKNFSINVAMRYRLGGEQYNTTLKDKIEVTNFLYNVDSRVYTSRWKELGDVTAFKALQVTGATPKTSRFVQTENSLSVSNINLQYSLRNWKWINQLGASNMNLTLNVAEPFYISTITRERGTAYPFARQFSFSVTTSF